MPVTRRSIGRTAALASVASLVLAVVLGSSAAPSGAQSADAQVTADKEGWWNRLRGAAEEQAPVPNPLGGTAPLPPPPTSVPAGAIAVGAQLGETDKVAAIGIMLPVERGGTVDRLVMRLGLAEGDGSQSGDAATGAIRACPVTGFFVPEENGDFRNRPAADCEVGRADGIKDEDGSWSFDLTGIARLWVDPAGTVFPNGVVLEPVVEAPTSFQVSFAGIPDGITFEFAGTPGEGAADPFGPAGGGTFDDDGSAGTGSTAPTGGSFGGSAGGSSGSSGSAGGGSFTTPSSPAAPAAAVPTTPEVASPPTTTDTVALPAPTAVSQVGNTFGNLPAGSWVALVLGVGLALLAASTLGPAAATEHAPRRAGGVSRALSQRSATRPVQRPATEIAP